MATNYAVYIIDYTGAIRSMLLDFVSMSIIDVRNDVGRWTITSMTKDKCPFQQGDGIVVYRNGTLVYCGILKNITEEYRIDIDAWNWTVSGVNYLELLKWRCIFPSVTVDGNGKFVTRYLTYTNEYPESIVSDIIENNIVKDGSSYRNGIDIVSRKYITIGPDSAQIDNVSYRFDNVFKTVMGLVRDADRTLLACYRPDTGKIEYRIRPDRDLSDDVVFSTAMGDVDNFKHTLKAPEQTTVLMSWNDSKLGIDFYKDYNSVHIPNTSDWRNGQQTRELFISPHEKDFNGVYSYSVILAIATNEANSRAASTEGYDITLNPHKTAYTYGYDYDTTYEQFTNDYKLGDIVTINVKGEIFSAKVSKVEMSVSYGKEDFKVTIGIQPKGSFSPMLIDIDEVGKAVLRAQNGGGE